MSGTPAVVGEPSLPPKTHEICRAFLRTGISAGMEVLDIGCGDGALMEVLRSQGARVMGIEIDRGLAQICHEKGFPVVVAMAEQLPFTDGYLDAIVCSVVLPYTDERRAVSEWGRVLRRGGIVNVTGHGIGYGLHYAISGPGLKRRFYGLRMLLNTALYGSTGRRLPGFLGDTICQNPGRLQGRLREAGLGDIAHASADQTLGQARFLCIRAVRS